MTRRPNEIVKKPTTPQFTDIEALAAWHHVPALSALDIWGLEKLASKKAGAGDWMVRLSVTTLIGLLVKIRGQ